jgi:hypothetical protein
MEVVSYTYGGSELHMVVVSYTYGGGELHIWR